MDGIPAGPLSPHQSSLSNPSNLSHPVNPSQPSQTATKVKTEINNQANVQGAFTWGKHMQEIKPILSEDTL